MPPHLPAPGRPVPVSSYRVQLRAEFSFDDAAAIVPYLADLGVTHLYCSPYLQAAPGSAHGYDVVDHTRLNAELGGAPAYDRLQAACRAAGLGLLVDVVPNHMAVSEPESQNAPWWDVLRSGPRSAYADWFDIDWDGGTTPGTVLLPVLGAPLHDVLADGQLTLDGDRLRYYDHEFPIAPGTAALPLPELLEAQHYRLAFWRVAGEELDYRRFFDVTTLAGVRVEDPAVFEATHALLLDQVRTGVVDGLRIDHPDGLADPGGYLDRLADATGDTWVAVEKILEPGEALPAEWRCVGTTGYDVLNRVLGLFVDARGEQPLTELYGEVTGEETSYDAVVATTKRLVLREVLAAEVGRLAALAQAVARAERLDATERWLREALVEVLASFEVYRAYVTPGSPPSPTARSRVEEACARARATRPARSREIDLIGRLALTGPAEFVTRFQQTCGPAMAKGVEDTAFYRYSRLVALNEVGGDPGRVGQPVAGFHAACAAASADWPVSMTSLSTHDTKRSEDVRARLAVLSESPSSWAAAVRSWRSLNAGHRTGDLPDRGAEYLLYQTLVGAWPITADRAVAYAEKASREAKLHTSWTDPDPGYDAALAGFVRGVLGSAEFTASLTAYVDGIRPAADSNVLAQKLVQLTVPGVADVYQGTELEDLSLVDPDNRRPVDAAHRRSLLAALDGGAPPASLDERKLLVTSRALRLRRELPAVFLDPASYAAVDSTGEAAEHVVAFARSASVVTVAARLPVGLTARGGWGATALALPPGEWTDVLTGRAVTSSRLADLLTDLPVALLRRSG